MAEAVARRHRARRVHWVAIVAGALVAAVAVPLAGCGIGSQPQLSRKELTTASPVAEFLGTGPRSPLGLPHVDELEHHRQDTHAELVAGCMAAAGFEYLPVTLAERLGEELLAAYALPARQFTQRYGYGATTVEVDQFDDPNQRIRDQLAPARQEDYDRALWGDPAGAGGGCHLAASAEVYGEPGTREAQYAEFDPLLRELAALPERIESDARLHEAHQHWARCLAEAGFPGFETPGQARASVFDQLPGDRDAALDSEQRAEVREYELALAPADFECQQRHVLGPRRAVTLELEQAFIDDNHAELARYRDWLTG